MDGGHNVLEISNTPATRSRRWRLGRTARTGHAEIKVFEEESRVSYDKSSLQKVDFSKRAHLNAIIVNQ